MYGILTLLFMKKKEVYGILNLLFRKKGWLGNEHCFLTFYFKERMWELFNLFIQKASRSPFFLFILRMQRISNLFIWKCTYFLTFLKGVHFVLPFYYSASVWFILTFCLKKQMHNVYGHFNSGNVHFCF